MKNLLRFVSRGPDFGFGLQVNSVQLLAAGCRWVTGTDAAARAGLFLIPAPVTLNPAGTSVGFFPPAGRLPNDFSHHQYPLRGSPLGSGCGKKRPGVVSSERRLSARGHFRVSPFAGVESARLGLKRFKPLLVPQISGDLRAIARILFLVFTFFFFPMATRTKHCKLEFLSTNSFIKSEFSSVFFFLPRVGKRYLLHNERCVIAASYSHIFQEYLSNGEPFAKRRVCVTPCI